MSSPDLVGPAPIVPRCCCGRAGCRTPAPSLLESRGARLVHPWGRGGGVFPFVLSQTPHRRFRRSGAEPPAGRSEGRNPGTSALQDVLRTYARCVFSSALLAPPLTWCPANSLEHAPARSPLRRGLIGLLLTAYCLLFTLLAPATALLAGFPKHPIWCYNRTCVPHRISLSFSEISKPKASSPENAFSRLAKIPPNS